MNRLRATGRHVTSAALVVLFLLPLLWTLYSSLTGSLLAFDQFFILTGGRHDTATVVIDIYREAFLSQDLGRAAAVSVATLAVLIVLNVAQLRLIRREGK